MLTMNCFFYVANKKLLTTCLQVLTDVDEPSKALHIPKKSSTFALENKNPGALLFCRIIRQRKDKYSVPLHRI